MIRKIIISIIVITLNCLQLLSLQKIALGSELGYGSPNNYSFFKFPFNSQNNFCRVGFVGFYTPDSAIFSLKTGILVDLTKLNSNSSKTDILTTFHIPVGCDFQFGKKCYLLGGLGIFVNHSVTNLKGFPFLQLGMSASCGVGFVIIRKWHLDLKYQFEEDITTFRTIKEFSPGGFISVEEVKRDNKVLIINIKYKF